MSLDQFTNEIIRYPSSFFPMEPPELPAEVWTQIIARCCLPLNDERTELREKFCQWLTLRKVNRNWRIWADLGFKPQFCHLEFSIEKGWTNLSKKIFLQLETSNHSDSFLQESFKLCAKKRVDCGTLFLIQSYPQLCTERNLERIHPFLEATLEDLLRVFCSYTSERFYRERVMWRYWITKLIRLDRFEASQFTTELLFKLQLLDSASIGESQSLDTALKLLESYPGTITRETVEKMIPNFYRFVFPEDLRKFLKEERIKKITPLLRVDTVPFFTYHIDRSQTYYDEYYKVWALLLESFPQADLTQDIFIQLAEQDLKLFEMLLEKNHAFCSNKRTKKMIRETAEYFKKLNEDLENDSTKEDFKQEIIQSAGKRSRSE